jgi:hypothetical protein
VQLVECGDAVSGPANYLDSAEGVTHERAAKLMVRPVKKAVVRLPPIRNPRRQLPFRFHSYDDLIADLGRTDALASSLTLSVRYFTAAAETFAKDVEKKRKETLAAGTVAQKFTGKDQLRAMWELGNLEAMRFAINTKNPEFPVLGTHTAQLLLVGVYQQAEVFLNGVRDELKDLGHQWPQRGNHVPLLEYTLQNLPGGHSDNKVKSGSERYDLFEYHRLMRNAFVHRPIDHGKVAGYFDSVKGHRETVASEFDLDGQTRLGASLLMTIICLRDS